MAVIKKRRSQHSKQHQLHAKRDFESSRLKPEQVNPIVHDESDTILYRSYLLGNFLKSAEYFHVLASNPVPTSHIIPPPMFKRIDIAQLESHLESQKKTVQELAQQDKDFKCELDDNTQYLKAKNAQLFKNNADYIGILQEYLTKYGLSAQDDRIVVRKNEFSELRTDMREAPEGYWKRHAQLLREKREKELALERQRQAAMEEQKRKEEQEAAERRRIQLEQEQQAKLQDKMFSNNIPNTMPQDPQDPLFMTNTPQLPVQALAGEAKATASLNLQQPQTQPQPQPQQVSAQGQPQQQDMLDNMFSGFEAEAFSNGFDEEFADLDAAFF